jgi:hypothetical protein
MVPTQHSLISKANSRMPYIDYLLKRKCELLRAHMTDRKNAKRVSIWAPAHMQKSSTNEFMPAPEYEEWTHEFREKNARLLAFHSVCPRAHIFIAR